MDTAFRTAWLEAFRRDATDPELRLLAAQGQLAPQPAEQLALLVLLAGDSDPEIAAVAEASLCTFPRARLEGLLARQDAPTDIRAFFAARGIHARHTAEEADAPTAPDETAVPTLGALDEPADQPAEPKVSVLQRLTQLSIPQRLGLAMKGSREERAILIRDPNKLVSLAVLSNPKLTETEVEAFARMTNVSEDVARTIASSRAWSKSYAVAVALAKNPKTPVALSMNLLARLNDRDLRGIATDRNVPEVLRATARRKVAKQRQ